MTCRRIAQRLGKLTIKNENGFMTLQIKNLIKVLKKMTKQKKPLKKLPKISNMMKIIKVKMTIKRKKLVRKSKKTLNMMTRKTRKKRLTSGQMMQARVNRYQILHLKLILTL